MQYLNRFNPIKLRTAVRHLEQALETHNPIAIERKTKLDFFDKHGLAPTIDAFGVSKSTIYDWKLKYKKYGLKGLIPQSKEPINKRKSQIHPLVKEFIKNYRNEHHGIGQDKIKPHLDSYCKAKGIKTISAGSIAIIIKELKNEGKLNEYNKISYNAKTDKISLKQIKRHKKQRRKGYNPKKPGDLIQLDTVHKFIDGMKQYVITAMDVYSKFAFAMPYTTLNSSNAKDFMERFRRVAPFEIKHIQTDNGLEFEKNFRHYVKQNNIIHFHNYPKRPQSNGCIERFNRTIQEDFINWNLHLLDDNDEFSKAMINWLLWYNTERVHCSIGLKTPMDFILEEKFGMNFRDSSKTLKKSSMLLDYTPKNPYKPILI